MRRAGAVAGAWIPLVAGCWVTDPEIGAKFLDTGDPSLDTEPKGDADTDSDADSDADTDADADADPFACADGDLGSGQGEGVAQGNTTDAGDDSTPVCYHASGKGGPDLAYRWVAPSAGCWELDTLGTSFDTVLYAKDACGGGEIGCNDDADRLYGLYQSDLGLSLAAGQEVLVVVDGYDADAHGPFSLDVVGTTALPADIQMGSAVGVNVLGGDSTGADDTWPLTGCEDSGADVILEWVAPRSANWVFDLTGSDYDTVLSLHRPCTSQAIACADQYGSGEAIDAFFAEGETVLVRIAGWLGETGEWQLSITEE